ncbi:hypothetical protein BABINDRAFT_172329 [Babjeviella inositovora NRRL Y-12698]|uniref:AMP-dependent synthetase/ligase domain-containing protein n=1 Tax=Babjeviella inositovora NRRL Y-12698 TaxID=984486 RepID=A0A1E3QM44_9ASCO|nr:uncharacterized protein BABINDRAFT_172329 [Babjeviella inositovora NRRL Y-12698]ODQ78152.1 hypothetical protein BABINDRAFT_172329 [Babjeviella inositovora NRRL Y-12698]
MTNVGGQETPKSDTATFYYKSGTSLPFRQELEINLHKPLAPRSPPTPQLEKQISSADTFTNILKQRSAVYKETAMVVLDVRGKEFSAVTWDKLLARAEAIGLYLQNKHKLPRGERICLVYKNDEMIEFTMALMACFMGGYVAVPIPHYGKEKDIFEMMNQSVPSLALLSDTASKRFDTLRENLGAGNYPWPLVASSKTFTPREHELAYVEFSKSPSGEYKGVVLSHKTLFHQMHTIETIVSLRPGLEHPIRRSLKGFSRHKQVVLSTLSLLSSVGLIIGCLFQIYTGNLLVWAPQEVMETPGLYANIVTRHRVNGLLADYIGLKEVIFDYQRRPNETRTFNNKVKVDLACVKWCLVNASTIDGEFLNLVSERWLRPLGCTSPQTAVCPMLTLSDFGGMVIAMRDWLGPVPELTVSKAESSELSEVMIDRKALMHNMVKLVSTKVSPSQKDTSTALRIGSFGHPIPDSTLAIVNPETYILANRMEVGEIWIDSLCLSGGMFEGFNAKIRAQNQAIFHAQCFDENGLINKQFLRTGLLGFTHDGKLYVIGLYEDRIRQNIDPKDTGPLAAVAERDEEGNELMLGNGSTTYHYTYHLSSTIAEKVREVYDCTFFDLNINDEYLPIAIVETNINDTFMPSMDLLLDTLDGVCLKVYQVLRKTHNLHLYCVMATEKNELPRILRSGGNEIANMISKRLFQDGNLRKAHFVKFDFKSSLTKIPCGDDLIGGIWSPYSSFARSARLLLHLMQVSSIDYREHTLDAKYKARLTDFKSILDILKFRFGSQGDEAAFHYIGSSEKDNVKISWKKLEAYIYGVCTYILTKTPLKSGDHVILMYSLSIDYIVAVYACFMLGMVPIPMTPFDSQRLKDEYPAFIATIKSYGVRALFVNDDIEKSFKFHALGDALKRTAPNLHVKSTSGLHKTKPMHSGKLHAMIADYQAKARFRDEETMCMIWLHPEMRNIGAAMNHKSLVGLCKVFKETFEMANDPMLGCVRHSSGIGFLQSVLMGVFLGSTTYLLSPVTFRDYPLSLFMVLSKYKIRDTFVTNNMLMHSVAHVKLGAFKLHGLKNMMVYDEGRTNPIDLTHVAKHFASSGLLSTAMASVYSHALNPLIASRSFMPSAPLKLYLDPVTLSKGMVKLVNPSETPYHIAVQDSGVVPVCTEIVIVNPETCKICREGEIGEIWVCSEGNLTSFTNGTTVPKDYFRLSQLNGKIVDGNPRMTYLRTGDLGFLYSLDLKGATGSKPVQPLYVLGNIADTFESLGLHHFSFDVEQTISDSHRNIFRNGVFRCNGYIIAVVETDRELHQAALVPVIINKVFTKHRLIIDIVSFVAKNTLPLSQLRILQRSKIISSYIGKEKEAKRIPLLVSFGTNYGEPAMVKVIKDIDELAPIDSEIQSIYSSDSRLTHNTVSHSLRYAPSETTELDDDSSSFDFRGPLQTDDCSLTPAVSADTPEDQSLHDFDEMEYNSESEDEILEWYGSDTGSVEENYAGPKLSVVNV